MRLPLALCLLASPALADAGAVMDRQITPGTAAFTAAAATLAQAAGDDCLPASVAPAWNGAWDAWLGIAHFRLGPQENAALDIAFWPDDRGTGRRTLARMIAAGDPMGQTPQGVAQISAAARGLSGLETLLFDPDFNTYATGSYSCTLVAALAQDLATQAADLETAWAAYAPLLRAPGAPGNATYLSPREADGAIFTQVMAGIEFDADQRLGRPMGTPDRPRPGHAESWRAGRSLRNLVLSLDALRLTAEALSDAPIDRVEAAFDTAAYFAGAISDPGFQDAAEPMGRLRLESLQGRIAAIGVALEQDIGEPLGIAPGFNSLDGD
ncbi:MAG: imelysin family protein [Rhodobacteraceae bacterium]|nr:imelysin family protein [Paracoccaceae bacterium]